MLVDNVLCVASLSTPAPVAMQPDTREKGREGKKSKQNILGSCYGKAIVFAIIFSRKSHATCPIRLQMMIANGYSTQATRTAQAM
jgi:hypothetical protein